MKSLFNPDSFLMRFLSRVADMMLLNALWLICCIPVFTIGAATSAVYHTLFQIVKGEESGIFKTYWQGFRSNFRQGTKVFLFLLLPLVIVIADLLLLALGMMGEGILSWIICGLPAILLFMVMGYAFPLTARFENGAFPTVKNALLLSIANFPKSLLITLLNLFPVIWMLLDPILFTNMFVIFLLGGFAWIAFANAHILNGIFTRLIENMQPEENA